MKLVRKRAVITAVVVAVSAVGLTAALASPPSGFHPTNIVAEAELPVPVHINSDGIKFRTKDAVDVRVQSVTIDPGGRSGWHHHPGMVIVAAQTGTVTFLDADCHATTYGPESPNGSVFIESGDNPGEARNTTENRPPCTAPTSPQTPTPASSASRTRQPVHDITEHRGRRGSHTRKRSRK
jgi:hypothetical protein